MGPGMAGTTTHDDNDVIDVTGLQQQRDRIVDPPLRSGKVAIVGFATESMGAAPWENEECEIWILNMLHHHVPRWDRLWEMHDRACVEAESHEKEQERLVERGGMRHIDVLKAETTRPIYTVTQWPDVPMSREFPHDAVKAYAWQRCAKLEESPYFTSTFAHMLLYAIIGIVERRTDRNVPEPGEAIWLAGIEMLNGEEYAYQRSCAEFYAGWVLGAGIELHIPARSALLESDGVYGYARAESLELLTRMRGYYEDRRKRFLTQADDARKRRNQAKADWNSHDGAVQVLDLLRPDIGLALTPEQRRRLGDVREQLVAKREAAELDRLKAQSEVDLANGAAQGVDWAVSHLIYLARGGKV